VDQAGGGVGGRGWVASRISRDGAAVAASDCVSIFNSGAAILFRTNQIEFHGAESVVAKSDLSQSRGD
jgi:hypothetical protein